MKPQPLNGREAKFAKPASAPLRDRIAKLFVEKLNIEVASPDADLMESGVLDSLTLVELLAALEQEMGIKISLETLDLENFRSVARIAEFLGSANGNGFKGPA